MTVKVGLISDVHATPAPVREALAIFRREGVDAILCAGDIAGYGTELEQTVALLADSGCRAVLGNHDLWHLNHCDPDLDGAAERYLRSLPSVVKLTMAGKTIYMVHASPPDSLLGGIRLLDERGALIPAQQEGWSDVLRDVSYDVLLVGHTHQLFVERLGHPLVVNPGSTRFNHSCAILHLPELTVRIFPLEGKLPVPAWNWGLEGAAGDGNLGGVK
ncbi:metallophosphoesterase family protein [Trichloromonas sp.]|uniref:metallophosphoesterase family protein n=1 Tax=Trichloromonas sp. TaxID=3069249 RepID=UPI003D8129E3